WAADPGAGAIVLAPGPHRVSLALDGYRTWSEVVQVEPGASPLRIELQPDPAFSLVGGWAGSFDEKPMTLDFVSPGNPASGVVRLEARASIDLGEGETRQIELEGTLDPSSRTIELSDPTGYSFSGKLILSGDGSRRIAGSARRRGVDYEYAWQAVSK